MDDLRFLHDSLSTNNQETHDTNTMPKIYLIEDDQVFGKTLKIFIEKKLGTEIGYFKSPSEFLSFQADKPKEKFCLITDITFDEDGSDGLLLIDFLKERGHSFESIVMTGFASIETAIQATKKGVYQYLTKPFDVQILTNLLMELYRVKFDFIFSETSNSNTSDKKNNSVFFTRFKIEPPKAEDIFCGMVGRSAKMREVFERIKKVSHSDSTVLISGGSGTGKELVAKALHNLSKRKNQKMVSVNCGAIPSELLESELFGHVKGAFTGAVTSRKGRFELADKGSIFLDEIGDMPLLLQVKILRVLQTRDIEAVGGSESKNVDVRIITATHRDLEKAVKNGDFREDLFYRLNVIPIKVPSLKDRREDIPLLISYFLTKFVSADGRNKVEFDDDALELLMGYDWPGNVRELENLMERLVILKGGSTVTAQDLPSKFLVNRPLSHKYENLISLPEDGIDLKNILSDIEDGLIIQALNLTAGNRNQASKLLKMNRTTLIEKMKKKGILHA